MITPRKLPVGFQTMSPAMGTMQSYQRYLFDRVQPCLRRRVVEIGVGHGMTTRWILQSSDAEVLAADIDEHCLNQVRSEQASPRLHTLRVDLNDVKSVAQCAAFQPDSIVCINVLEHIEQDEKALRALAGIAVLGAKLALIVPAHPLLYGRMDSEAGHFRRYTRASLHSVLVASGWTAVETVYINALGALGWYFHNRLRRSAGLADHSVNSQMLSADRWLPRVAAWTDPVMKRCFGLSVLAIAQKTSANDAAVHSARNG